MRTFGIVFAFLLALSACTNPNDLDQEPVALGDFHFGHNVVVAPNLIRGPVSREASKEEWITEVQTALDARFRRYEGARLYHLGVSLEGYVLAIPGIPVVAAPKSVLLLRVTAWDDQEQRKLNEMPELLTVVESLSGETIVSSGLTQTKEVQMANLSANAAKLIELWLVDQNKEHGWFDRPPPEPVDEEGTPEIESVAENGSVSNGDAAVPGDEIEPVAAAD